MCITDNDMFEKGNVYWYKSKGKVYCCAVLEITNRNDYLIAISGEIKADTKSITRSIAIESDLYTIAWFNEFTLLSPRRYHMIFQEGLVDNYNNRAGIWINDKKYINQNPGDNSIWQHERRNYTINGIKLRDTFSTRYIPKTVISGCEFE